MPVRDALEFYATRPLMTEFKYRAGDGMQRAVDNFF